MHAKADSGASRHYVKESDQHVLTNISSSSGPTVYLPNNNTMTSFKAGSLPLPAILSSSATKAHIFRDLQSASLVSLGQLCDDNCNIILDKNTIQVFKDNTLIITGTRNPQDGLWDIPLQPPVQKLNVILRKDKTKQELANYLHACCFSPTISTFVRAIRNGNFITWPGLDQKLIERHLLQSTATAKGHLDQERQGLQSTKTASPSINNDAQQDFFPPHSNEKTNDVCTIIQKLNPKTTAYSDLTGRFPYKSSRGNQYILIVYHYDSNAILAEPLSDRRGHTITKTWQKINNVFVHRGIKPNLYVLDNEISSELKTALAKNKIDYQLTPPHIHRRNAAERAIRTFKNHFLAGLASCDPKFPVAEWD